MSVTCREALEEDASGSLQASVDDIVYKAKRRKLMEKITNVRLGMVRLFNPVYTGGLFHCNVLDKSIYHLRGFGSIPSLLFYFLWKILLANSVDSDQMPQYVASDLGLHCLPVILLWVSR